MSGSAPSMALALRHCGDIEQQTAALSESIRQQKSRWNSLASVSILPPELLAEIFLYTPSSEENHGPYSWVCSHARYRWIKVTHICQHWREVALACPSLWTGIVTSSCPEWVSLLLERSKQAPLQIDIRDVSNMEHLCDVVREEIHRVQSLRIMASEPVLRNLFDLIKGPMPLLETFVMVVTERDRRQQIVESLSATLQCHQTPRLYQLETSWPILRWNYLTSMTLKNLRVFDYPSQVPLDAADFFDALEGLPLLESLYLDGEYTQFHDDIVTPPIKVFTLSRLRSIHIVAKNVNCIDVFNHLSLPELSSIVVHYQLENHPSIPVAPRHALVQSLADKIASLEELRTLYIDSIGYNRIRGYTIVAPDFTQTEDIYPAATVELTMADSWINVTLDVLPLTGVHTAVFRGELFDEKEEWLDFFRRLPNLEVLHVDEDRHLDGGNGLLEALKHCGVNTEGEQPPVYTYSLPKLRMLELSKARFADRLTYHDGRLGEFESGLHDCLMERYEYGVGIHSLCLTRCGNLDWRGVQRLIDIVGPTVFWDGDISLTN